MRYVPTWERMAEERGEKRGEKRGEEKGKLEIVMEMLKKGMDKKIIADVSGFPMKRIDELAVETH